MRKTSAPVAASLFIVASVVSEKLPMAQHAIEGDMKLEPTLCASVRIVGLLLILLQTVCLACAARVMLWHVRWPAKYLMGSYLLNLNFLDAFFISPGVRRSESQYCSPNSVFNTWGSYGSSKRPGG